MKHPRIQHLLIALAIALARISLASAQDMHQHMHDTNNMQNTAAPKVSGEIRKVDADAGKITIRHGEIPNLEMPAMTMVFRAASPDMLDKVKTGDQVLFTATKENGVLTVTSIELQTPK